MFSNITSLDGTESFSILTTTQLRRFFLIFFCTTVLANLFAALSISLLFSATGIKQLIAAGIVFGVSLIAAWALLNLVMVLIEWSNRVCDEYGL